MFVVKEYRPLPNRWMLTGITDNEIKFFLDQKMITPEVESALSSAMLDGFIANHRAQATSIADDQQRLRENMKALKGR